MLFWNECCQKVRHYAKIVGHEHWAGNQTKEPRGSKPFQLLVDVIVISFASQEDNENHGVSDEIDNTILTNVSSPILVVSLEPDRVVRFRICAKV